jgi:hypothetical protein
MRSSFLKKEGLFQADPHSIHTTTSSLKHCHSTPDLKWSFPAARTQPAKGQPIRTSSAAVAVGLEVERRKFTWLVGVVGLVWSHQKGRKRQKVNRKIV